MTHTLVLLRHGRSDWNDRNLFTGWVDSDLSERGVQEARRAGALMVEHDIRPDVVHTSVLVRAIRTAWLALDEMQMTWLPVHRSWRLNERHYGALQGLNKAETAEKYGADQVKIWRRSYDIPPEPIEPGSQFDVSADPRYRELPPHVVPRTECLEDTLERTLPYWEDAIVPDLRAGRTVLVAAHGNSLRALVKHLDGIADDAITELNIPTGNPLVYELDDTLTPTSSRYLDPDAAAAGAAEVAAQAG
ncbi:MAG TPA: phosphoglyceromutase [Acidimicrobiales bacterium]|nr:phosphoglyceromutase [Acidimicrobiales bacterium]